MRWSSVAAEVRRARPLLGTRVEIRARARRPEAALHAAVDAAFAAVDDVHRLMSFHAPDSDVSRLNAEAHWHPLAVHPQTLAVLRAALELARASAGIFDPCVGARLQRWGLLPSAGAIAEGGGWGDIELAGDGRVRFRRPLRIDLGGIAKGYAVDCAVAALRGAGVEAGMVDAGGDLRVFGVPQRVFLRHPLQPAACATELLLQDEALATSSCCFSRTQGKAGTVSALLDPRSGRPYTGQASVSVRAPQCMHADALTKLVLFGAPAQIETVLSDYGALALVQVPDEGLMDPCVGYFVDAAALDPSPLHVQRSHPWRDPTASGTPGPAIPGRAIGAAGNDIESLPNRVPSPEGRGVQGIGWQQG
ncbi:MAG: FAD:protein FMN transferase [Nevskia sp.]|nr:FAD:protein FMN transferase [Nevskia sp.]